MAVPNPNDPLKQKPPQQANMLGVPKASPVLNPHQEWINNPASGAGGMEVYTTKQNDRWQTANQSNDLDLMQRLIADSQRVGYNLNPYKPPAPPPTPVTPSPTSVQNNAEQYTQWQNQQNEILNKYKALMDTPFNYNPETDPRYTAFRDLSNARAESAAKDATRATEESMNNRGILNSSVTASQIGQIHHRSKQEAEREALAAIPQFQAEARADYQDRIRNAASLLNFASGRADAAYDRSYTGERDARGDFVTDRNFDRGVLESDRSYDRNVLEGDRSYDRGVFESDRSYNMQQAQQEWDNAFRTGQFDWQKAQQTWENAFQEKNFQRQMEEAAAARGLQWASLNQREREQIADQAFREKQFSQNQLMEQWKLTGYAPEGISGITAGTPLASKPDQAPKAENYFKFIDDSVYVASQEDPVTGNRGKVVTDPGGLGDLIFSLDLTEAETRKLFQRYGLKWGN